MESFTNIQSATKKVLADKSGKICFAFFSIMIFLLFVMVPVWTTPGNDFLFQLSLYPPVILLLLIVLSLANGLVIAMQLHIRHEQKAKIGVRHAGSGLGILGASLAATLGCAACYSSILAIFGLAGTAFIVEHRAWFALFALGLTVFAVYHSAKKIEGGCKVCQI